MSNFKQINYIKTMLSQASRRTKQEFEDSNVMLDKETPYSTIQFWINRLEKEVGVKA
jgi:hypothetical protein